MIKASSIHGQKIAVVAIKRVRRGLDNQWLQIKEWRKILLLDSHTRFSPIDSMWRSCAVLRHILSYMIVVVVFILSFCFWQSESNSHHLCKINQHHRRDTVIQAIKCSLEAGQVYSLRFVQHFMWSKLFLYTVFPLINWTLLVQHFARPAQVIQVCMCLEIIAGVIIWRNQSSWHE